MDLIFLKCLQEAGTEGNEIAAMAIKTFQVGCARRMRREDRLVQRLHVRDDAGAGAPRGCAASPSEGSRVTEISAQGIQHLPKV